MPIVVDQYSLSAVRYAVGTESLCMHGVSTLSFNSMHAQWLRAHCISDCTYRIEEMQWHTQYTVIHH